MSLVKRIQEELKVEKENSPLFRFQRFIRSKKFKRYKREVLGVASQEDEMQRINNEEAYYYKLLTKKEKKFKRQFLEDIKINDKDVADYLLNIEDIDEKEKDINESEGFFFKGAKISEFDEFTFSKLVKSKPHFKKNVAALRNLGIRRGSFKDLKRPSDLARSKRSSMFVGLKPRAFDLANFKRGDVYQNKAKIIVEEEEKSETGNKDSDEEELTFSEFVFDYMRKID